MAACNIFLTATRFLRGAAHTPWTSPIVFHELRGERPKVHQFITHLQFIVEIFRQLVLGIFDRPGEICVVLSGTLRSQRPSCCPRALGLPALCTCRAVGDKWGLPMFQRAARATQASCCAVVRFARNSLASI